MELVAVAGWLMSLMLMWGFSIERSRKLEARHTLQTFLHEQVHCHCGCPPMRVDKQDQLEQRQIANVPDWR